MLDAQTLLDIWEQGETLPMLQRSLLLLQASWPQLGSTAWAQVSLGKRDWHLLYLRQQLFGDTFDAVAHCPQCAEKLEMGFTLEQLCPAQWQPQDLQTMWQQAQGTVPAQLLQQAQLAFPQWGLTARVPNTADLLASSQYAGDAAYWHLLACCLQFDEMAQEQSVMQLAAEARSEIVQKIAELDPLAEVKIDLQCPACGHAWQIDFDILSWLWNEIGDWVPRMLQQVHCLALAYGWSEAAILAMPARRRRQYLEMVGAYEG